MKKINNSYSTRNVKDNTTALRNKDVPKWLEEYAKNQIEKRNDVELRILQALQKQSKNYNFSFIFQEPLMIGDKGYILDFVIFFENQTVVLECDGSHHFFGVQKRNDITRDADLRNLGYEIERIFSKKVKTRRDATAVILQLIGKYKQSNYFVN